MCFPGLLQRDEPDTAVVFAPQRAVLALSRPDQHLPVGPERPD